jgi:hypothetical protein
MTHATHPEDRALEGALLSLRIGLAILFLVWALDKLLNVGHAQAVFAGFYGQADLPVAIPYALGALQLLLVLAFTAGAMKTLTYGALLLMHLATTIVSLKLHLDPFGSPNILFWANWPILGALIALFILRHRDRMLSV